ncbi:MAG: hypothetical protein WCF68_12850 [Terriglobales bacterium]
MRLRRQLGTLAALALTAAMFASPAHAQVRNSAASPISVRAQLGQSLTVSLSGSAVNFNLVAGNANNPGSTSITATTSWTLNEIISLVTVYAFFGSSTVALTDGAGDNIPSADFQISDNGGAFTALTNTAPFGGANAGLSLGSTLIFGNNTSSRTDVMKFNINLSPLPNLPPGTYTGTLTIQAQAI